MQAKSDAVLPYSIQSSSAVGPDNQGAVSIKKGDPGLNMQGRLPPGWQHFEYAKAGTSGRKAKG